MTEVDDNLWVGVENSALEGKIWTSKKNIHAIGCMPIAGFAR